jgi:hypothetical protein
VIWNARVLSSRRPTTKHGHASLEGDTPLTFTSEDTVIPAHLNHVRLVSHCRDLVQLPVAA